MPKEHITMNLRLSPELHAVVRRAAAREKRSVNNLIVFILEQNLLPEPPVPVPKHDG
jgi:predicted HicB family RNase H-like nuclease